MVRYNLTLSITKKRFWSPLIISELHPLMMCIGNVCQSIWGVDTTYRKYISCLLTELPLYSVKTKRTCNLFDQKKGICERVIWFFIVGPHYIRILEYPHSSPLMLNLKSFLFNKYIQLSKAIWIILWLRQLYQIYVFKLRG